MNVYIRLLRPKHWVKNLFVFLPLFFGLGLFNIFLFGKVALVFIAFSLAASGSYILNDFFDKEEDRKHPEKKNRPLANGEVSPGKALWLMAALWTTGGAISFLVQPVVFYIVMGYIVLNVFYSLKLKHVPVLDVFVIGTGFVLRLFAGSTAAHVPLSMWIVLVTFLLALFLGFAKRRNDVLLFLKEGIVVRRVIDGYSLDFLNIALGITAATTIVSYIIYTTSPLIIAQSGSQLLYMTSIFVIAGILRYVQLIFVSDKELSPTAVLWGDRFVQITIILWAVFFGIILYT